MLITSFFGVAALKISIEKCFAKNLNPDGSRQVLELVSKHLDYYEDIAKRSIHMGIADAIDMELYEIEKMVKSIEFEYSTDVGENVKQKVESFTRQLKTMEERYGEALYKSFCDVEEEEEDEGGAAAVTSKVIGVSEVYEELKQNVMDTYSVVTSLVGMPGIGKTTLAKKIFHDPAIVEYFDHRVWIRVGRKCGVKDIPRCILAEIDPDSLQTLPAEAIHEFLKASLKSKRYLFVLDDVWDKYMAYLLDPYPRLFWHDLEHPFIHPESGSRILLTSRIQQEMNFRGFKVTMNLRLLTEKESWDLFCEKVFSGRPCPPRFVKAGKKISKNCEGLPLTIL